MKAAMISVISTESGNPMIFYRKIEKNVQESFKIYSSWLKPLNKGQDSKTLKHSWR